MTSMKYILVIGDGMADWESEGQTPLEKADTPNMDFLAHKGQCGRFVTVPEGFSPGSDVAIGSILGADPTRNFTGRGPLEAAAMGVSLEPKDVAARCNLITETDGKIEDYSAGHITSEEGRELIEYLNKRLGTPGKIEFFPGVSYRHLLVLRETFSDRVECAPPHDYLGKTTADLMVKPIEASGNETARLMNELITKSRELLGNHEVNQKRSQSGKRPGNLAWFWSPGHRPTYETIPQKFGVSGAVITAVDLVRGLGIYSGLEVIDVPGATGYLDTNYEGKAEAALEALKRVDFVVIHVEAPDEAGHEGSFEKKVQAIEDLDKRLLGVLLKKLKSPFRIAVCADHPTPIKLRTHSADPPPFVIYDPIVTGDEVKTFTEREFRKGIFGTIPAIDFLALFFRN